MNLDKIKDFTAELLKKESLVTDFEFYQNFKTLISGNIDFKNFTDEGLQSK